MRVHWSSVSSWNRDTFPGFQNPADIFIRHALGLASIAKVLEVSAPTVKKVVNGKYTSKEEWHRKNAEARLKLRKG